MKKLIICFIIGGLLYSTFAIGVSRDDNQKGSRVLPPVDSILERVKERPSISREEFQRNWQELNEKKERAREEIRRWVFERKGEIATQIQAFREQLKGRLKEKIKNTEKQMIIERVYDRINFLNDRMTIHYLNTLEGLERILERIESRTAKAKINGKDVTAVENAIVEARQKIESAQQMVKDQAGRLYQPPQIESEKDAKTKIGELRQKVHNDLKKIEEAVKEARKAVRQAVVLLAQIHGIDSLEVPGENPATQSVP